MMTEPRKLGSRLKIMVSPDPLAMSLLFYTNDTRIPSQRLSMTSLESYGKNELEYFLRRYIQDIITSGYATKEEIDIELPNIYRYSAQAQIESERNRSRAFASPPPMPKNSFFDRYYLGGTWGEIPEPTPLPPEPEFEVNLMECLVGWKGWRFNSAQGFLHSPSYGMEWRPDMAAEAKCGLCTEGKVVLERHSCGIYATDEISGAKSYGTVRGQVYGWGRYVRGDKGWRAQFAYPKSFHLTSDQGDFVEGLKKYHVPIFIDEPLRIYDPEEEGYGYGETEENGNSGTVEGADSCETGGSDSAAAS